MNSGLYEMVCAKSETTNICGVKRCTPQNTHSMETKIVCCTFSQTRLCLAVSAIFAANIAPVYAGPEGGTAVGGAGSIHQNGNTTTINQTTDLMVIE
jgi:hypothetical protein